MKCLLRAEKLIAIFAVVFLMICVGHYSGRNWPGEELSVITSRTGRSADVEERPDREVPETLLPGEKINLNTASVKDLARLPGIGEHLAEEIVAWREKFGGFHSLRELGRVTGIGAELCIRIEPYITVDDIG